MIHIRHSLIGLCAALASVGVLAQGSDGHTDHHPMETAAPAAPRAPALAVVPPSRAMDSTMMAGMGCMQDMHEKMAAAETLQERQALMSEHTKILQNGMRMMESMHGQMTSGKPPAGMNGMRHIPQKMEEGTTMMESR